VVISSTPLQVEGCVYVPIFLGKNIISKSPIVNQLEVGVVSLVPILTLTIPRGDKLEVKGLDARDTSLKIRKKNCVKLNVSPMKLVLDDDISLHEITTMDSTVIVRNFLGGNMGEMELFS